MTQTAQQMDKETVRARLQENPGVILEALARNSGFSMAELIELLPEEMWKWTDGAVSLKSCKCFQSWAR